MFHISHAHILVSPLKETTRLGELSAITASPITGGVASRGLKRNKKKAYNNKSSKKSSKKSCSKGSSKGGSSKGGSSKGSCSEEDESSTTTTSTASIVLGDFCIDFECEDGFLLRENPETRLGDDRETCCFRNGVCEDDDCGEFECIDQRCVGQCPTQARSGGVGLFTFNVDLFQTQGEFELFYQMYDIQDELNVFYEGENVFSTGGLVSGGQTIKVPYGSSTSVNTEITLELRAPTEGTLWDVSVECPAR